MEEPTVNCGVNPTETTCSHCEELRVVGPDHRNTQGASHDDNCATLSAATARNGTAGRFPASKQKDTQW
jgi:hypothetical protein